MYAYPARAEDYALTKAGKFYTTRRNGPVLGVVLHITAGLQDLVGDDGSAEGTARWAASSSAQVSWHVGVDSDSVLPCLPDTYTAWHAKGYNSRTFGIEISKLDVDWSDMPAEWVTRTLRNAAKALAPIVKKYGLPLTRATKAQVDAAVAAGRPFGFVYHSTTSAGTRSDPGANFPFDRLVDLIRAELTTPTSPQEDDMQLSDKVNVRTPDGELVQVTFATILARTSWVYDETLRQKAVLDAIASKLLTADEVKAAAKAALDERIAGATTVLEVKP